jgi:hypothetical protein
MLECLPSFEPCFLAAVPLFPALTNVEADPFEPIILLPPPLSPCPDDGLEVMVKKVRIFVFLVIGHAALDFSQIRVNQDGLEADQDFTIGWKSNTHNVITSFSSDFDLSDTSLRLTLHHNCLFKSRHELKDGTAPVINPNCAQRGAKLAVGSRLSESE